MFEHFDFSKLDDDDFKEDSVREEFILPILQRLGYSATGQHQIIRSKTLPHPYVMIGSKRHPVYIIPDYILKANNQAAFILDAKSPSEPIYKSKAVEQAYSYAIHPDIRVSMFVLCNGRELVIYELSRAEPVLRLSISEVTLQWDKLNAFLSPAFVLRPHMRDFIPDYGLHLYRAGYRSDFVSIFNETEIGNISKSSDYLVTVMNMLEIDDKIYGLSLDFRHDAFNALMEHAPALSKKEVALYLSHSPFNGVLANPFTVGVTAHLGDIVKGEHEDFVPFIVETVY